MEYGQVKITPSRFSALSILDERGVDDKEELEGSGEIEIMNKGKGTGVNKNIEKTELEPREIEEEEGIGEADEEEEEIEQEELIRQYLPRTSKNNHRFLSDTSVQKAKDNNPSKKARKCVRKNTQ